MLDTHLYHMEPLNLKLFDLYASAFMGIIARKILNPKHIKLWINQTMITRSPSF